MLKKRIAIIDCQTAGISGDMLIGALIDLGANAKNFLKAIEIVKKTLKCKNIQVKIKDVDKGIRAKRFEVKLKDEKEFSGEEILKLTKDCLKKLKLSEKARNFALASVSTLVKAEAKIHKESLRKTHLHEISSPDTVIDVIGVAVLAEDLGIFDMKVFSTPVAVGGGLFKFSHGITSSPAPATLEILKSKNFPFFGGPVESELATPTGVSLLVNLAQEVVQFYPLTKPIAVGYGAGKKNFPEVPNVLRIVLAEPYTPFLTEEVYVLETNVDDVTGETIGYATEKLLKEGAKDVCIIPTFTKKGRPGSIIQVITDKENLEKLMKILIEETGTLGVRVSVRHRHILDRKFVQVKVKVGKIEEKVRVKVARDEEGKIVNVKPEYEDVKRLAEITGKPLKEIVEIVGRKIKKG
jgi:uncharacterized protein (TIGR00299 family) protein